MRVIYEPRGKAREYSPLAVNLYSGCGHKCAYCYVPKVLRIDKSQFDSGSKGRDNVLTKLGKDAAELSGTDKQVLMSFTTDPYNPHNKILGLTRKALEIFLSNRIPVAILTKGGKACLTDKDIFSKFGKSIKVGMSMTYDNDNDSRKYENGAALPSDRVETLKQLNELGIRTWVSFEPIMQPEQTLSLMKRTIPYVDEYQIGMLSGDKRDIDWNKWVSIYLDMLRNKNKGVYIKDTLRLKANKIEYTEQETNMDALLALSFPPLISGSNLFEYSETYA